MSNRRNGAAFSQRIRLEWLELTAQLVAQGQGRAEIEARLQEKLSTALSVGSSPVRGSRDKAISVLLRTWVSPPSDLRPMRDDALDHLQRLPEAVHLPLHWGMAMCVYPFFGTVAEVVGRLMRLQGQVGATQVQRFMREQLGDRESVANATGGVLRSLVDWGVLHETAHRGISVTSSPMVVANAGVCGWLIEATLRWNEAQAAPLRALADTPALFAFSLGRTNAPEINRCSRLEWFRQGLDEDMVALRAAGAG